MGIRWLAERFLPISENILLQKFTKQQLFLPCKVPKQID